ncbi:MAG: carbon storage regulator, partial [Planctomycetes bacterium]|nr:carbon storage regulator [Planctomycetota bacterium]
MLVLSRKPDESVILGDEVTVTVEEISGDDGQRIYGAKVRLGFQSPRHVSIHRSEYREKIEETSHEGGPARRPKRVQGKLIEISDAQVRLRIQLPRKIPVCCTPETTAGCW